MIRPVTQEDKEWVLNVSEMVYSGTKFGWNREDAAKSFDFIIRANRSIFLRGERTFFYAFVESRMSDYSKNDAYMELLVGEGGSGFESFRLVNEAVRWSAENNVDRLTLSSVTEHDFGDLFLKRLKATPRIVYDIQIGG